MASGLQGPLQRLDTTRAKGSSPRVIRLLFIHETQLHLVTCTADRDAYASFRFMVPATHAAKINGFGVVHNDIGGEGLAFRPNAYCPIPNAFLP